MGVIMDFKGFTIKEVAFLELLNARYEKFSTNPKDYNTNEAKSQTRELDFFVKNWEEKFREAGLEYKSSGHAHPVTFITITKSAILDLTNSVIKSMSKQEITDYDQEKQQVYVLLKKRYSNFPHDTGFESGISRNK